MKKRIYLDIHDILVERIGDALGFTIDQVRQFSYPMLREILRLKHPDLAHEIHLIMHSPEYFTRGPDWSKGE